MRTNKEILTVVNQMVSDGQVSQDVAEKYFPELRESEADRKRRINAPEKIYIHEASAPELAEKLPYHIEYVRKDAFIERVARFLEYKLNDRVEIRVDGTIIPSLTDKKTFIEDVKEYMKGE